MVLLRWHLCEIIGNKRFLAGRSEQEQINHFNLHSTPADIITHMIMDISSKYDGTAQYGITPNIK